MVDHVVSHFQLSQHSVNKLEAMTDRIDRLTKEIQDRLGD